MLCLGDILDCRGKKGKSGRTLQFACEEKKREAREGGDRRIILNLRAALDSFASIFHYYFFIARAAYHT